MSKKQQSVREWVVARPVFIGLAAMILGILVGSRCTEISNKIIFALLIQAVLFGIIAAIANSPFLRWFSLVISFVSLGLTISLDSQHVAFDPDLSSKKQVIQASVTRVLGGNPDHRIILLKSGQLIDGSYKLPGYGRLSLRDNHTPLVSGDLISFRSSVRRPINRGNPGEYDWEIDCKSEGITWLVNSHGKDAIAVVRSGHEFYPSALLSRLRQAMSAFIDEYAGKYFDLENANAIKAIHKGIILGDRAEIDSELNKAFSGSGLVHMLSASGSHVTIVAAMTFFLVKASIRIAPNILLWVPLSKIAAFCCIPTICVYCLLVGLKPPAMRAGIMGVVFAIAIISERRWDSLNTLALAALIILLFYPLSIFTPSFQLSFAAVAGILLIVESSFSQSLLRSLENDSQSRQTGKFHGMREKSFLAIDLVKRPFVSLIVSSLAATMAITPLIIHIFHSVPIYSLVANLTADFALTLGLSLGLISTLTGVAIPKIGQLFLVPADFFVWLVIKIALIIEQLPCSTIKIPNLGYLGLFLSFLTTGLTFFYLLRPRRLSGLIIVSSWAILIASFFIGQAIQDSSDKLRIVFLNVGNGDSAYIKPPGTAGFFVDTGPKTPYFDSGQSIITPFLLWQAVQRLDAIIISHPEADHMGGTLTTMKNFRTERLFVNPHSDSDKTLTDLSSYAESRGIPIFNANSSLERISIGETWITFLHPALIPGDFVRRKLNNSSVVARVDYRNFSVLLTGDLEREGEKELLNSGSRLAVTVFKVPHHGGRTSATSQDLLSVVVPKIAVISAEFPPRGGLPNQEVINRLKDEGTSIFWTGRDGAITIETDGIKSVNIITGKDNRKVSIQNPFEKVSQ